LERIGVKEGNYCQRDEEGIMDGHNNASIKGGTNEAGCLIVSIFIALTVRIING
jgi:hypothetical protein